MSKALEALENIKSLFVGSPVDLSQQFDIIETALKEKEALEKLLEHEKELNNHLLIQEFKALKKIKAFELIKEKRVDVDALIYYLKTEVSDGQVRYWYNNNAVDVDENDRLLNIEDVICLKEVLL